MTDDRLETLFDKQAITEVLYSYARGWDRFDEEALRSCFHEDAENVHGSRRRLAQDFITNGLRALNEVKSMTHMITNPMIEISGDRAVSECSFLAHHRRAVVGNGVGNGSAEEDMFIKGRYLDVFERRDGVWKIAVRRRLHDFERVVPPADTTLADASVDQLSDRKPADPLYGLLNTLV
jgi:hypothetical protein